jgi:hypothetical protein
VRPREPTEKGLGDNFNYTFGSNCANLLGVVGKLDVTQDTSTSVGFTFRLNAYGATGAESGWQQYGFVVNSAEVQGFVNSWTASPSASPPNDVMLDTFSSVSLPSSTLPAGYTLTVALTDDANGNVTGPPTRSAAAAPRPP